ncbi:Mut7-C RNAse domain-containing protein [Rufibacter glacialis]|uniref:Mut7-C RNAse domain-containing protein n=1 Tax=Rufibacter glacialis TaxID=1259555 RepID=A0A5M8QE76_9BACT|nr:Mut7-C RNAse domain-containing protein [Rufibacter glacialis]KAA6434337.1 hypothetical protein FOE74_09020 [Rufibacter glacialis]GGK68655.1 hypothetical protein GCM10011405_15970 [Rufibacter glacialis]
MANLAYFLFHGALNDFLPKARRGKWLTYSFEGAPALKDAVEAFNVPHPEVGSLHLNGRDKASGDALLPHGKVEVFPAVAERVGEALPLWQHPAPVPARFILDVHLGKLARYLRLLGFDTHYDKNYDDATIAQLAEQQERIILTRDVGLLKLKRVKWGYWLRSQQGEEQLQEVLYRFSLAHHLKPFTRCMACNGPIQEVAKEAVVPFLEPKTALFFQSFYQCVQCQRVYWQGSHFERMQRFLHRISAKVSP